MSLIMTSSLISFYLNPVKRLTILKFASYLYLILTTVWSIAYFHEMNDNKGWGLLWMAGLYIIGLIGLGISFIIGLLCNKFIPNQSLRIQNTIEAAILTGFILFVALRF